MLTHVMIHYHREVYFYVLPIKTEFVASQAYVVQVHDEELAVEDAAK